MKRLRKGVQRLLTDRLNMPKDIIYDYPRLTMIGHIHLYIENHQGLSLFESYEIRVKQHIGTIQIQGKNLVIKNLLPSEMVVEGEITNVQLLLEGEGGRLS
ncbi:sporulation protein YqfC [Halalkalibacillus sediminis]|uniref:Sporulation protein YqfC n=1 Tax=Halalkalibacillus sediminis TaxID=2018042 RepID=A0A2I0QXI7_9BACI|nr:sporulation protein YqfC [Halalkalibacillus sediminis]PKR79029.1 sporulation protein YqfC [Halalkalibacillus sediminis]